MRLWAVVAGVAAPLPLRCLGRLGAHPYTLIKGNSMRGVGFLKLERLLERVPLVS